jgi:type IV pilus assembly protein PilA
MERLMPREEQGYTLVELMVAVFVIGVLIAIALPVFLGARERVQNRAAQSDLRNAIATAKVVYADTEDYSAITIAEMSAVEPSLTFVAAGTASSAANDYAVSFRVFNYGEVNVARLSESGTCYYMRTIDAQGPAPTDVPGSYTGSGSVTCSGDTIAGYSTTSTNFPGW